MPTLTDLVPDDKNANRGTKRGLDLLDKSLRDNGVGRGILLDRNNRIVAGNKTVERAVDLGLTKLVVVDTDGDTIVATRRTDLDLETDPKARSLAYFDNRAAQVDLAWSPEQVLADLNAGVDLSAMFFDDELAKIVAPAFDELEGPLDEDQEPDLARADVPDALFPTDNDWGVPVLDANLQAQSVVLPVTKWGTIGRKNRMTGTYFCYTDDYKFTALWADPSPVVNSRCAAIVEPNFSTNDDMPQAVVLWGVYRKRWLARYWQQFGIRIFVDLNVEERFADLNMLGVPTGWRAYATRWLDSYAEPIPTQYERAKEHAGGEVLFLVIGGWDKAAEACQANGWVHIREHAKQVNDSAGRA